MPKVTRSRNYAQLGNAGKRVSIETISLGRMKEPRLRFDRTAIGLIGRLQRTVAQSVPEGRTVVVTVTAPIRQDSKTGAALAIKIQSLLATSRLQLRDTIYGNRIEVRILRGGGPRTSRLIGFVHNRVPSSKALFNVARSVLACMGARKRPHAGNRWLIVENPGGLAPIRTVRQVCLALRARSVFKRILVADAGIARTI